MADDLPLRNVKRGTALLVTCLVETLNEIDPGARARFIARLDSAYAQTRDESSDLNSLELLSWTRELITGFSNTEGQGLPFFKR